MKLSKDRLDMHKTAMERALAPAFSRIGEVLNIDGNPDLNANFTIHRNGESITYEIEVKEVKRQPTYIEGEPK